MARRSVNKKKELLYRLVSSMQRNDWTDEDIKDILGKNTIKPKSLGLATLYRVTELYAFWLRVRKDHGLPKDKQILEDINSLTIGDKARSREQRQWRLEKIKVHKTEFGKKTMGPAKGVPMIDLQLATCNLRCGHCTKSGTWVEGNMISLGALDKLLGKNFDYPVLNLTGGEPVLWQNVTSLQRTLYRWCSDLQHQVHLETNGTIIPRKIMRDVCGLITVKPKLEDYGDKEFWKLNVKKWEEICPPIWAPELSKRKEKITNQILHLFKDMDPERMWPRPLAISDNDFARNIAIDMGWKINDTI